MDSLEGASGYCKMWGYGDSEGLRKSVIPKKMQHSAPLAFLRDSQGLFLSLAQNAL